MSRKLTVGLVLVTLCVPAFACLWDDDTIEQERSTFPGTLELMTGKFPRHSEAFYRWRIADRMQKIAAIDGKSADLKTLALYDDLAVAYDKVGDDVKAIEAITEKERLREQASLSEQEDAEVRYRSLANLGTFHIHAGDYEEGLVHIRSAIKINPEAHFGREVYQQRLVEFLLAQKAALQKATTEAEARLPGELRRFSDYLVDKMPKRMSQEEKTAELKRALAGVQGMMRFGNHDSPVLLTALGDLLTSYLYSGHEGANPNQLASRAYLLAAKNVDDLGERKTLLESAAASIQMQRVNGKEISVRTVRSALAAEVKDADAWYRGLVADEKKWIRAGKDVEALFREKYFEVAPIPAAGEGSAASGARVRRGATGTGKQELWWGLLVCGLTGILAWALIRSRSKVTQLGS